MEPGETEGQSDASSEGTGIRLVLEGLDQTVPEYTNIINVSFDRYAFQVVFARAVPPVVWSVEEWEASWREGLRASVVGRIVVPPEAFREFIRNMEWQLDQFEKTYGPAQPDTTEVPAIKEASDAG